jgi:hypothetical protein
MAGVLLTGLLLFWGRLATGAAACFSNLAPPPDAATEATTPTRDPRHRQIRIERVKTSQ